MSVAPTVRAVGTRAGLDVHASVPWFPAAIEYVMPEAMELATAVSKAVDGAPPRLMLATAGFTAFAVTQFTPAITWSKEPFPVQSRTRTETSDTFFATP